MTSTEVASPEEWPERLCALLGRRMGDRVDAQSPLVEALARNLFVGIGVSGAMSTATSIVVGGLTGFWYAAFLPPLFFALPLAWSHSLRRLYGGAPIRITQRGLDFGLSVPIVPWSDLWEVSLSGVLVLRLWRGEELVEVVRPSPWRETKSMAFGRPSVIPGRLKAGWRRPPSPVLPHPKVPEGGFRD